MPVALTYPGVYIEEISSGVHTIAGVATSIAAFVGYTKSGLDNRAKRIFSFADFERNFGGLAADSELSYAVQQFFQNGGTDAYVVRVPKDGSNPPAAVTMLTGTGSPESLTVTMLSTGSWSNDIVIDVDYDGITDPKGFNLTITDFKTGLAESFSGVTVDRAKSNFVEAVINDIDNGSKLARVSVGTVAIPNPARPAKTGITGGDIDLTKIKNNKDYTIKLEIDVPNKSLEFVVINQGDPIPQSIASVCNLFTRQANVALSSVVVGAKLRCVPSSSGKGLNISLNIPNAYDAQPQFKPGTTDDADSFLHLTVGNATANVSHYWPNSQRGADAFAQKGAIGGSDGTGLPSVQQLIGEPSKFTGIYALDKVDLFNILCIPDATRAKASDPTKSDLTFPVDQNTIYGAALTYCQSRRAFLVIDCPAEVSSVDTATDWISSGLTVHDPKGNAAAYFPRLKLPDPLNKFQLRAFAPCGVVAGLYARIDGARGVWKAPAGVETSLNGVQGLVYALTDPENGALNPLGLNCFRNFPVYGAVSWGGRTIAGADAAASEWKYIPVRRFALFLEESLYRGTKWVVFEPNDEPLWAQIRLNLGAFMHTLFLQGAFQGNMPQKAYFVKCDSDTTTQDDINRGVVNIAVGFAPLKPAEFVVIQIQQIAGDIQT